MLSLRRRVDPPPTEAGPPSTMRRDLAIVFLVAAGLRLVAGAVLSGTYDYDEFVVLALSRQFAHGFHPYRDFVFFHPPGSLLVGRALDPLTSMWWPAARAFTGLVDSGTAALTYAIGCSFMRRRAALAAGFAYAASPLALIAGVRIGPDPLIAFLGVAGLCVLVRTTSARGAVLAGGVLGLAISTKYAAVLLLPVYVLAAPRRSWATLVGSGAALLLVLAPYLPNAHELHQQTIVFQDGRGSMPLDERLATAGLYWLVVTPLAVLGLARRAPLWVKAGFLIGGAMLLAPQDYYHYFLFCAPFAALLSAPLLARMRWPIYRTVTLLACCGLIWVAVVTALGSDRPLYVTAARLSDIAPTVDLLRSETPPGGLVLADRYEFPFLARRPPLTPYFWNVRPLIKGSTLERQLPCAAAVVMATGASSGYPIGLTAYLNLHYRARRAGKATVWLLPGNGTPGHAATGFRFHPSCQGFVLAPRGPCPRKLCVPGTGMDEIIVTEGRGSGASGVRAASPALVPRGSAG